MPNVPFDIEIGDGMVPGSLHVPAGERATALPAMLICDDVPGRVNDYGAFVAALTERLLASGAAVAHFAARTDDAEARADASTLVDDAMAVFGWLMRHEGIDPESIGILSIGLGAVVAAGLAARTDQISAVCLVAPGTNEDAIARLSKPNGASALLAPECAETGNGSWVSSFADLTPARDLAVHDRPTLIVHGSADRVVESVQPYVDAIELADHHLEHESIARADHNFADPDLRGVCLDRIERFLLDNRPAPKGGSGRSGKNGKRE